LPAPSGSTAPTTAASTTAAPPASKPEPDPYGDLPSPLALLAVGQQRRMLVHVLDDALVVSTEMTLGEVRGNAVAFDPAMRAGLPSEAIIGGPAVTHVAGAWKKGHAFLTTSRWTDYGATGALYERKGGRWINTKVLGAGVDYAGLVRWGKRILAIHDKGGPAPFELVDGSGPLPKGGVDGDVVTAMALPSGELLVVSSVLEMVEGGNLWASVARFGADGRLLGKDRLPSHPATGSGSPAFVPQGIFARTGTEIYVFGGAAHDGRGLDVTRGIFSTTEEALPYLVRFDGKTWQFIDTPAKSGITGVATMADGSLLVSADKLYRRASDGTFSPLPTPRWAPDEAQRPLRMSAGSLFPAGPSDIFLTGGFYEGVFIGALARFAPAEPPPSGQPVVLAQPPDEAPTDDPTLNSPPPITLACNYFVQLFTLNAATPADYDFPATRAAVRGHKELFGVQFVETESGGKRQFGATAPDREVAMRLSALIKSKIPSSTPQILCETPKVRRTLQIDLGTGEVIR
jgi:hypothetical protein